MWMWIANKFAKFHAKRLNQRENIPKSFRGATFLKHPVHFTHTIRQAWWCRATLHLSHSWGCALNQPVRQASVLVRKGDICQIITKGKKERKKKEKKAKKERKKERQWLPVLLQNLPVAECIPRQTPDWAVWTFVSGLESWATTASTVRS